MSRYRGIKAARAVVVLCLLIAAQILVVRQVQWVRRELMLLEEARAGRSQAQAEVHRLERELALECRPDVIARRAEELGLRPTRAENLLFMQGEASLPSTGYLPPCIDEVLHAATVGSE
jgi:hypothetical protein